MLVARQYKAARMNMQKDSLVWLAIVGRIYSKWNFTTGFSRRNGAVCPRAPGRYTGTRKGAPRHSFPMAGSTPRKIKANASRMLHYEWWVCSPFPTPDVLAMWDCGSLHTGDRSHVAASQSQSVQLFCLQEVYQILFPIIDAILPTQSRPLLHGTHGLRVPMGFRSQTPLERYRRLYLPMSRLHSPIVKSPKFENLI